MDINPPTLLQHQALGSLRISIHNRRTPHMDNHPLERQVNIQTSIARVVAKHTANTLLRVPREHHWRMGRLWQDLRQDSSIVRLLTVAMHSRRLASLLRLKVVQHTSKTNINTINSYHTHISRNLANINLSILLNNMALTHRLLPYRRHRHRGDMISHRKLGFNQSILLATLKPFARL